MTGPFSGSARLGFVGDLMFGRLTSRELRRRDPEWFWGDVLGLLKSADGVFGNLECAITTTDHRWRRSPKTFHFRADPAAIKVLQVGNIRFVSLANNHAMDFEVDGLKDTLRYLDDASIAHAGAGVDVREAAAPSFVDIGPLRVAVFAITDNMPEAAASEISPGLCYVDPATGDGGPTASDFARAREDGAHLVVVAAHLGPNMVQRPDPVLRAYKRRLAAEGADIVHGHSAHVIQGVERVGTSLVFHDAGDFVDDYAVDPDLRNDLSFLMLVDASISGFHRLQLVPVRLYFAQVRRAPPRDADLICERMQLLSREFGLTLDRTSEGLEIVLSSGEEAGARGLAPPRGTA
jgi:poly-gamma-glutamate capsule biosynthesis protein CapA/YwtB (metallophosphatase superfamily)